MPKFERRFVVTEVPGSRLPWRVHVNTKDPRVSAEGAWATKEEADAQLESLNKPCVGVPLSIPGIQTLGCALAKRFSN